MSEQENSSFFDSMQLLSNSLCCRVTNSSYNDSFENYIFPVVLPVIFILFICWELFMYYMGFSRINMNNRDDILSVDSGYIENFDESESQQGENENEVEQVAYIDEA